MTPDDATANAVRVLKKAEKQETPEMVDQFTSLGNTWLRLAQDLRWAEAEARNAAREDKPDEHEG